MNRSIPIDTLAVFNQKLSEQVDANVQTVSLAHLVRSCYEQISMLRRAGKTWKAIAEILNESIRESSSNSDVVIKSASLRITFGNITEERSDYLVEKDNSQSLSLVEKPSLSLVEDDNAIDKPHHSSKEFEVPTRSHSSGWKEPKFNVIHAGDT